MQKHEENLAARINGNALQPLAGASVTVTDDATGLPASLYSDDGVTPLAQPVITGNEGEYAFYAANGEYTVTFSGTRFATFTRKVILADPSDNPYLTQAAAAAPTGAAQVGFQDESDGALPTTVATALGDTISVTRFLTAEQRMNAFLRLGTIDLGTPMDNHLAACMARGCSPYYPGGVYATSHAHALTVGGGVASPCGDGPASSVIMSMGNQDVLTITGASECSVRGIGFDKVTRNQLGRGLVVINTAYAVFDHVTAYGFANGIYTEGVLTSLFIKPLARFCEIGMYLNYGASSNPNAITIINPSLSLNTRFGLRANQPASLMIKGGSCEGNGWDTASFHGGMYISNAGGEGGVGVTIDGVHMEQNKGEADIYIASTLNAGTVYNILNCPIFAIDNTNVTANRIYFENGVQQHLKLRGNSFKHFGSYTPNAARKYVAALDTTLLTVDTGGDNTQFYSTVETPNLKSWGPNATRDAMLTARASVANTGAAALLASGAYNIASATRDSVGQITCAFVRPMVNTEYQVVAITDTGAKLIVCTAKSTTSFTLQTRDLGGSLADSGFDAIISGGL